EAAGDRAGRDAAGRLAGGGSLERLAAVGGEPLDRAGEVGVPGAGAVDGGRLLEVVEAGVAVGDEVDERGARGASAADAAEGLDVVGLDLHPPAAPEPALAAEEFGVDEVEVEFQPGREPGDGRDEPGPVALPGGLVVQRGHRPTLSTRGRGLLRRGGEKGEPGTAAPARAAAPTQSDGRPGGRGGRPAVSEIRRSG